MRFGYILWCHAPVLLFAANRIFGHRRLNGLNARQLHGYGDTALRQPLGITGGLACASCDRVIDASLYVLFRTVPTRHALRDPSVGMNGTPVPITTQEDCSTTTAISSSYWADVKPARVTGGRVSCS